MDPVLLVVACEADAVDDLSAILWAHGPTAVAERDTPDGPALVAGFDRRQIHLVVDDLDHRFTWELMEPDPTGGYLDSWRDHARRLRVGRFTITPPWLSLAADASDPDVLIIDPGRAFSAGTHPTTRLALGAIADRVRPGLSMLDVGTGSGVLAVAAARLGAHPVVAVDTDPAAVEATAANAARNDVAVEVRPGSLDVVDSRFDLAVANVPIEVHRAIAPKLAGMIATSGGLIVTGFLAERSDEVAGLIGGSIRLLDTDEGWACLAISPETA